MAVSSGTCRLKSRIDPSALLYRSKLQYPLYYRDRILHEILVCREHERDPTAAVVI